MAKRTIAAMIPRPDCGLALRPDHEEVNEVNVVGNIQ